MRNAVFILLAIWVALSALLTIAAIGKPREPITPGVAVAVVITSMLMITGFSYLWAS